MLSSEACRMRSKERDVVGNRLLNAFRFDGQMAETSSGKLRALPGDRSKIGRRRKQLPRDRREQIATTLCDPIIPPSATFRVT
jgi:hypothetical protein